MDLVAVFVANGCGLLYESYGLATNRAENFRKLSRVNSHGQIVSRKASSLPSAHVGHPALHLRKTVVLADNWRNQAFSPTTFQAETFGPPWRVVGEMAMLRQVLDFPFVIGLFVGVICVATFS